MLAGGGNADRDDVYGRTVVWDTKTGKIVCATPHKARLFHSVFSPVGTLFATAGEDGQVQICDAETGKVLRLGVIRGTPLYDVAWSADGKKLVGAGATKGYPVFDVASTRILHIVAGPPDDPKARLNTACFTPDGTRIITGSTEKTISIWDASTYRQISQFPSSDVTQVAEQPIHSVACSIDGRWIAAGRDDASVAIHDPDSGNVVKLLKGHVDVVAAVAFGSDGTLASAGYDETIKLWDVAAGKELRTLKGHENWVFGIAFSPDSTARRRNGVAAPAHGKSSPTGSRRRRTPTSRGWPSTASGVSSSESDWSIRWTTSPRTIDAVTRNCWTPWRHISSNGTSTSSF